ncbi:hypothetical protein [Nannocystis radixulma]|uniref:Lipoprotein n=1 Tax=Nannocystis radixulma TaxID=2995305 RepID=A0ABT5BN17_9BACT|nr:hypothetical protein [Nannocystis radixulma]MDC0674392.1 hypothetical protein [Nannocystis radixulma]
MPISFASTRARTAAVSLFLLAALPDCTCADRERNNAYHAYIQSEIDQYTHAGTREQVAADARQLLLDRGFELPPWDGNARASTEWKATGDATRMRWHIDASAQSGGSKIRFTAETQQREPPTWTRDSRRRDLEVEHELLSRLAPDRAAKVKVEEVGQETYDLDSKTLWTQIQASFAHRGESFLQRDPPVDITSSTDWVEHLGDEPSRVRHDAQIVSAGPGRYRIELHRVIERGSYTREWTTTQERRDGLVELDLVRRRDPTAASSIEVEAQRRGQQAYDEAIDDGAIACSR